MEVSQERIQTKPLKIALIGYGKMGKAIEALALQKGIDVGGKIDPLTPFKDIYPETLQYADVCIDFSHPASVMHNVRQVAALGKSIVMGTTGWYDQLPEMRRIVKDAHIGFIYSPNFSIGINIFLKIAAKAAELFSPFSEFDVGGVEIHHNQKADIPSGTAEALGDILLKNSARKHSVVFGNKPVKDPHGEIHFSSLRVGSVPGTHEIFFDSPSETIQLSCSSRDRLSFASGALMAAEWVATKKGFFTFNDLIEPLIKKNMRSKKPI